MPEKLPFRRATVPPQPTPPPRLLPAHQPSILNMDPPPHAQPWGPFSNPNSIISQMGDAGHILMQNPYFPVELFGRETPASYEDIERNRLPGQPYQAYPYADPKLGAILYHGSKLANIERPAVAENLIASGAGDQWQGHGIYLAEHPAVAQFYRNIAHEISHPLNMVKYDEQGVGHAFPALQAMRNISNNYSMAAQSRSNIVADELHSALLRITAKNPELSMNEANKVELWKALRQELPKYYHNDAAKMLQEIWKGGYQIEVPAAKYQAEVPDEAIARMLHLDQPLAMQPMDVRKSILDIANQRMPEDPSHPASVWDPAFGDRPMRMSTSFGMPYFHQLRDVNTWEQAKGWDALHTLAHYDKPATVSKLMNEAGIPGNKYLDKKTRSLLEEYLMRHFGPDTRISSPLTEEQLAPFFNDPYPKTHNLVVFDPANIQNWKRMTNK